MRVVVMFDLPTDTSIDRRHYRWFRKFLIKEGFVMAQESIYTKICINNHAVKQATDNIRKNRPPKGLIQVLAVTERQYASMEFVVGEQNDLYVQSDSRMVVL